MHVVPPKMSDTLKSLALQASKVICVAYTDEFSIDNQSLIDLQVGCKHNAVSSNQDVLHNAPVGSLAVVTAQSGHFVIGILGEDLETPCRIWRKDGGKVFKYARKFTPITDVMLRASVMDAWTATCDVYEVDKQSKYLFHSRFCGYGHWYIPALHAAIKHGVFPLRTTTAATRTTFE